MELNPFDGLNQARKTLSEGMQPLSRRDVFAGQIFASAVEVHGNKMNFDSHGSAREAVRLADILVAALEAPLES